MGLTSENSLIEIQKLYDLCFCANSMFDRIAYISSIKFNLIKFGDWFHHNVAHLVVGDNFADGIEAFGEERGDLFYRGTVPKHAEDYLTLTEAMKAFTLKAIEIEKQCVLALKTSAKNGDEGFEDYLRNFNVENITPLIKQAMVFHTAIQDYVNNNDLRKWNKDFTSYLIPYFKGGN